MKLNISVKDILDQKISDIQSRIPMPIRINTPYMSFSNVLKQEIEKTTNRTLNLDTSIKKYPLVSGSYESVIRQLRIRISTAFIRGNSSSDAAHKQCNNRSLKKIWNR